MMAPREMVRCLLVLGIACALVARADARTVTGYVNGEKVSIKLADVGKAEAEVHTAIAFRAMAKAARNAGIDLAVRSGFRSYAKQAKLYRDYRNGEGNLAARPGFSNHESGRALDLYVTEYKTYEWLEHHASEFGFHRTVPGEPWHWEYLGGFDPKTRVARRTPRRAS
jgi:LAS superfamily LD-carboxypeptidase LdcB